jgi:transcriptional antiterminator RfaH
MQTAPAWYSARTKPKHDHIAAANLKKSLGIEVFFPKFRLEKLTKRGLVRIVEPLFPGYIFVRCVIEDWVSEIQHTAGVGRMVQFGDRIPCISDAIIQDLQMYFGVSETVSIEQRLMPGDEVSVASGAFAGLNALVLKSLPARKRVQILLDILGRPTPIEVAAENIVLKNKTMVDFVPFLAMPVRQEMFRA